MTHRWITLGSVFVALVSLSLWAADKFHGHDPAMNHSNMVNDGALPEEGGQAAFAAIIEIVGMLEQGSKTDWAAVDIDGLRAHLLDMNHLVLHTEATKSIIEDTQIQFDVRGTPASIPSIHKMVTAHSRFIQQSRNWIITPELNDNGATLTIVVEDSATLEKVNALGFYGFMSLDSHHQAHHYQMAIGKSH